MDEKDKHLLASILKLADTKLEELALFDASEEKTIAMLKSGALEVELKNAFDEVRTKLNEQRADTFSTRYVDTSDKPCSGVLAFNYNFVHFDVVLNPVRIEFNVPKQTPHHSPGLVGALSRRSFYSIYDGTVSWYAEEESEKISSSRLALLAFEWLVMTFQTH